MTEPWTDFGQIYDEAYYRGEGSDPSVDYAFEFEHPESTVRRYEWTGVHRIACSLVPPGSRWLDFGCGSGGLVRHVRNEGVFDVTGFDSGAWARRATAAGFPVIGADELARHAGTFDLVTAIEVIEHVIEPLETLRTLRRLLKPGGYLFLTTGNADRAPRPFSRWSYVAPEIHVSYFTPRALDRAYVRCGFEPVSLDGAEGWRDIVRFKVLKGLRVRTVNAFERALPWGVLARMADARHGISRMPAARAA